MNLNPNNPDANETAVEPGRDYEHVQATSGKRLVISIGPFIRASINCHDFNALLMDMLARFADCAGGELQHELETAFGRICGFLEIDRAGLWQTCGGESFTLEYLYPPEKPPCPGEPEVRSQTDDRGPARPGSLWLCKGPKSDSKNSFPWMSAQVRQGRTILFSSLSDLPTEAEQDKESLARFGTLAGAVIPFSMDGNVLGAMHFALEQAGRSWPAELVERLKFVTQVLGNTIVRNIREEQLRSALSEMGRLKDQLGAEGEYLKQEIKVTQAHREIIGQSKAIKRVLHKVEQVAPVDCSVLITGETGTGKELIARAIHRLSSRHARSMVVVNCAALPAPLIESELFGRVRGAYTGALTSSVGRFEAADGSTIFLDEIGELCPEIQAKLLRILQDGQFQRLGSSTTQKVNVRVIAATNKDLAKEVRAGKFREDLYYRLRVFPINVPPLRERIEDIRLLVSAFVEEFSSRMNKQINRISPKVVEALEQHPWPGNIRELRNILERSVILSPGDTLVLPNLNDFSEVTTHPTSLAGAEREHILKTLEDAGWRVKGPYGAAKRLEVKPSTLYSRMAKLGVHRVGGRLTTVKRVDS